MKSEQSASTSNTSSITMSGSRLISANFLALILAALAMLGPFAVDGYLPAFPAIQAALLTSELAVQQTLTAYMAAFAVMILWHGALSDTFGRRRIILIFLVIFSLASLACAFVNSIEWLLFFRALQGISAGAGVVIGRDDDLTQKAIELYELCLDPETPGRCRSLAEEHFSLDQGVKNYLQIYKEMLEIK